MVFELPADAPDHVVERVERTHEFLVNQLGIRSRDIIIVAYYNTNGDGFWVVDMEQFPRAADRDLMPEFCKV